MIFACGLIYYNALDNLKRLIPTIVDNVDYIFAIDGKFVDFPDTSEFSTDGSTEYLQQFPNVKLAKMVGKEWDKRNKYLEMCRIYGVTHLLILDSDECVMTANWPVFKENMERITKENPDKQMFSIRFLYNKSDFTPYPRLWVRPYEIEYYNAHCVFKNKTTGVMCQSTNAACVDITGIMCAGDDKLWGKNYLSNSFKYQEIMIKEEIPFRNMAR